MRVYNDFMADPEIGPEFLKLYQRKYPKARVPELETLRQVEKKFEPEIDATKKELSALKEEMMAERVRRKIDEERDRLRAPPFGLSDSEIEAVEKIAAEEGVSYTSAAQLYSYRAGGGMSPSGFVPRPRAERPEEDWRKELKNPDSPLFKDTDNYLAARRQKILKEIGPLRVNQ